MSNLKDMDFKQAAGREWKQARLVAFSMTRRKQIPGQKGRTGAAGARGPNPGGA